MDSKELRKKYLKFFEEKGHAIIPSASLVPANDPTVLFTTAGMHPLVPYLMGQAHPAGKRLVNVQKSLRTDDIDEVGDETHNTFFEMLGNWSLGDYWKDDAIKWSYEFLTDKKWLGLAKDKLAVTVFAGDQDAPFDQESFDLWKGLGVSEDRIGKLGKKDNWWGPPGATGPCGPDTEIFYWTGDGPAPKKFLGNDQEPRWVEIWNNVFMQYQKTADGKFEPLKQRNVDTGMGMERATAVLEGKDNVYDTDLFRPIISKILSLAGVVHEYDNIPLSVYPRGSVGSGVTQAESVISVRVIADHIRAATFLISDGVTPSNKDRGYILRRLIRRIVTRGKRIGITKIGNENFLSELTELVIKEYAINYPELNVNAKRILVELDKEEAKFRETLTLGLRKMEEYVNRKEKDPLSNIAHRVREDWGSKNTDYINLIPGKDAFDLYQSYGFPPELLNEELARYGMGYHKEEFESEFKKHQDLSRTASAGMFKGGLASNSDKVVRLHTATHLMNAALRKVLGDNVWQKGSNITEERTRFDFTHDAKMTEEQKKQVEDLVNTWIIADLPVKKEILSLEQARQLGAIGVFGEKYPDTVSVYTIGNQGGEVISREFCGGPHVEHTGIIGRFKIQKEEAVSAGVRRIKAVIE